MIDFFADYGFKSETYRSLIRFSKKIDFKYEDNMKSINMSGLISDSNIRKNFEDFLISKNINQENGEEILRILKYKN
jgi:hypothetical protein